MENKKEEVKKEEENYFKKNLNNYSDEEIKDFELNLFNNLDSKDKELIQKIKLKLSKEFDLSNNNNSLDYNKLKDKILLNSNNVLGIKFKTYLGFEILKDFFNSDEFLENFEKVPALNYKSDDYGLDNSSFYNIDYINYIISILKLNSRLNNKEFQGIKISTKDDYPLSIESKDLAFILAPRTKDYI